MLKHINHLVQGCGYTLASWNDRYSKGIWVICTPLPGQAAHVIDASSDGDFQMEAATVFLLENDWLPIEFGRSLDAALQALEARLASRSADVLDQSSDWSLAVWDAFVHFEEGRRSGGNHGDFDTLPKVLPSVQRDIVTEADLCWKPASELVAGDLLAEIEGLGTARHLQHIQLRRVEAVEFAADGEIVVRQGPIGLAITCFEREEDVRVVVRGR